jgi:signal transduction histidine kinase
MSMERKRRSLAIALVAVWVVFTVTLAAWWLIFGLRQLDLIKSLNVAGAQDLHRYYQMLMWEGGILIASLIGGGLALFYYAKREQRRHAQVEEFFAAFTHDAKTAIASLRLQAESLREDFANSEANPLLERLLSDTLRLQLQLENSLFLVNLPRGKFFLQPIDLADRIDALRLNWPDVTISLTGDAAVMADERALESVMTNLVQNSVIHGRANEINIKVRRHDSRVMVTVSDNGQGFKGDPSQLGKLFVRPARSSGSGVGLYIVQQLAKAMNGTIQFGSGENSGFVAELDLPEAVGTHASGVPPEAQHAGRVRTQEHAGGVPNHEATVTSRR